MTAADRGAFAIWRLLLLAQCREAPARLLVTVIAIASGVALGAGVYLVNSAALNEFGLATKRLVGESDVVVRGPREGFSEQLFVQLARDAAVSQASPVLELEAALPGRRDTLQVLGVDPFRAAALQPALIGDIGGDIRALFRADSIYLSSAAALELKLRRGDQLTVIVGSTPKTLHVLGIMSEAKLFQALGLMDIASAQWTFNRIGSLNRIDLRLSPGTDVDAFRGALKARLPAGVLAIAPQVERDRARSVTRAYRVNLNMLALVALWTGAFLVFSTQSLSVLRRRRSLALLRALGVTRGQLQLALIAKVPPWASRARCWACWWVLPWPRAFCISWRAILATASCTRWGRRSASHLCPCWPSLPWARRSRGSGRVAARAAARQPPAGSLKGGDGHYAIVARSSAYLGLALLAIGAALSLLPPIAGLPIFRLRSHRRAVVRRGAPGTDAHGEGTGVGSSHARVVLDTAVAQLRENVGISTLSLASIIVSFSLMVAMAIMVYSFRVSFEHWLGKLLPADMQLREPLGNDTAFWSAAEQAKLASVAGVSHIEFRRTRQLLLDPARPPVTLIARGATDLQAAQELPLLRSAPPAGGTPAWISEAVQDLYGYRARRSD